MLFNYTKTDNPYMKQMGMEMDINMVNEVILKALITYLIDSNSSLEINKLFI